MLARLLGLALWGFFALGLTFKLEAQPIVLNQAHFGQLDVGKKVEAFAEAHESWDVPPERSPPLESFRPILEAQLNEVEMGVVWTRLSLDNQSEGSFPAKLFIPYFLKQVQIYGEQDGTWQRLADASLAGDPQKFYEDFGFFSMELQLRPGLNVFYIRSMKTFPRQSYGIRLADLSTAKTLFARELAFRLGIFGFYLAIFAFVAMLWLQFRDLSLTYYLFYVLSVLLYFFLFSGTYRQFFEVSWITKYLEEWINIFSGGFGSLFAYLFAIHYLRLQERAPKLRRLCLYFLGSFYLLIGGLYFFSSKKLTFQAISLFGVINFPMLIGPGLYFAFKRDRKAYFYTLGWSFLGLGILSTALNLLNVLPDSPLMRWAPSLGVALEMLVLCAALTDSFRQNEKEQWARIEGLNSSLAKSNQKLETSLQDLTLEVTSRVSAVKDLAHRGNNPLHASHLALDELQYESQQIRTLVLALLGDAESLEEEGREFLQHFQDLFQHQSQLHQKIKKGLKRMSEAIHEIRALSGVDGHYREYFSFEQLIPEVLTRLEDELGEAAMKRLLWLNHNLFQVRLLAHPLVFTACLERLIRFLVLNTRSPIILEDGSVLASPHQISFQLTWSGPDVESLPLLELERLIGELRHTLKPYGVLLSLTTGQRSCLFVNPLLDEASTS